MASSATLLGSPQKKLINISPMKQRYLDSLQDTGLMTEPKSNNNSPDKKLTSKFTKDSNDFQERSPIPLKKISKFSAISTTSSPIKGNKDTSTLSFSEFKSAISSPKKLNTSKTENLAPSNNIAKSIKLVNFDASTLNQQDSKTYTFLCRVAEAQLWINSIIKNTDLPDLPEDPIELINKNMLKDGVYLATVVKVLEGNRNIVVHQHDCKFPYLLMENIELFLHFCFKLKIPDHFKFESVDLYENKNFAGVIETIHCIASALNGSSKFKNIVKPMVNLYGKLQFSQTELGQIKRKLSLMGGIKPFEFFDNTNDHKSSVANRYDFEEHNDIGENSKKVIKELETKSDYTSDIKENLKKLEDELITKHFKVQEQDKKELTLLPTLHDDLNDDMSEYTPDAMTTSLLNQITSKLNKRNSINSQFSDYRLAKYEPSVSSSITLADNHNIPKLDFKENSADENVNNSNLSYYAKSVSSQFSSPRRRRRARLTGDFTHSTQPLDNFSEYSSATLYSEPRYPGSSLKTNESSLIPANLESTGTFESCVVSFQSLIRASQIRFKKYDTDSRVDIYEEDLIQMQSYIKGYTLRTSKLLKAEKFNLYDNQISELQANTRGKLIRKTHTQLLLALLKSKYQIESINDNIKAILIRTQVISTISRQRVFSSHVINLQSFIKGRLARSSQLRHNENEECDLITFQSFIRAKCIRNKMSLTYSHLKGYSHNIVAFQSLCRGKIIKNKKLSIERAVVVNNCEVLSSLSGHIKGAYLRNYLYKQMYELELMDKTCIELQSSVKGVLTRYCFDVVTDYISKHDSDLAEQLQSVIRGKLKRSKLKSMDRHYHSNVRDVLTIQKHIKRWIVNRAYSDLMNSANPQLKSVARFSHLLNGTTPVYESEDKLNTMKDVIDSTNLDIIKKENSLMVMAKKLMALKNNIENSSVMDNISNDTNKILNKVMLERDSGFGDTMAALEMMKCFEKLMYLLQNDPFYFRMFYNDNREKVEKYIKLIFYQNNGSINNRESALIIKLITELITYEIEKQSNLEDYLFNQDYDLPWKRQLHVFLLSSKKEFLNGMLFETVQKIKEQTLNDNLSFESDPLKIYNQIVTEYGTDMTPQEAIEIPAVKERYVSNMISLWNSIEEIQHLLIDHIDSLPIEILHLCTKSYHVINNKSEDEFDALEGISKILIGGFINDYLLNFDAFASQSTSGNYEFKNNMRILSNSLSTVFAMRKFKGYYQQLNVYVEEIGNDIAAILNTLIIPPDFQKLIDEMIYRDMKLESPPILTINAKYLLEIQTFLDEQEEKLPGNDPVAAILSDLSKCEEEMYNSKFFRQSSKIVNLKLNPSSYVLSDVTNRSKPLYNSVMWGLVVLMQVINYKYMDNVFSMLTHEDNEVEEAICEEKLQFLLDSDKSILKTNSIFKKNPKIGYLDLKMLVAEKLVELDRLGLIDKNNKYQSLLNDIANNLKTHQYFKQKNEDEIEMVKSTLEVLSKRLMDISKNLGTSEKTFYTFVENLKPNFNNSGTVKKHRLHFRSSKDKNKMAANSLQRTYTLKQLYESKILFACKNINLKVLPVNYFGNGGVKYPNISFTISTNNGKSYVCSMKSNGDNDINEDKLNILDLLEMTVTNRDIELFKGEVKLHSDSLFKLLIRDFIA